MKLVTFGIDKGRNLIIQFPVVCIQPYMQQLLILYQMETVPVPIIDKNKQAHTYTQLQIDKLYIALNSETYVTTRQQALRTCKRICYGSYCKELLVVKHKTKYSCESAWYISTWIQKPLKKSCKFNFYYNKADITPDVLDSGNEIILANWPNDKHIICNINNAIVIKIPSHPYVLVNRCVLCTCSKEVENHFLLESLAACQGINSKLVMYYHGKYSFY